MKYLKLSRDEIRTFIILMIGCILGSVSILPYSIHLLAVPESRLKNLILLNLFNSFLIYPLPIYLGIILKRTIPVTGTPFFDRRWSFNFKTILKRGIIPGLLLSLAIGLADLGFQKFTPEMANLVKRTPLFFYGILASFYGGFVEEVLCRFFLMALLFFPLRRCKSAGAWVAIFFTAIAFGIGHLPATAKVLAIPNILSIPKILIARSLLLNGTAGILFGWLYWRQGLELAIICHFSTDIGLQIIRLSQ